MAKKEKTTQINKGNEVNKVKEFKTSNVDKAMKKVETYVKKEKETNEHDVRIANIVMQQLTEQERIKLKRKQIEMDIQKLMDENANSAATRQNELYAKMKIVETVTKGASTAVGYLALATVGIVVSSNNVKVECEKIKQDI